MTTATAIAPPSARRGSTLRLHFTAQDILRTTVLTTPDPMWELTLSLFELRTPSRNAQYAHWQRKAGEVNARDMLGPLSELIPAVGNFPDFLTPHPAGAGIDRAVEQILSTPRNQLFTDLDPVRLRRELSPFGKAIGAAERDAMRELAGALHQYYDRMVRPHWDIMSQVVRADAAIRTRHLMAGGVDKMLANLGPMFHWKWPVLEAPYVRGKEIRLNGRGLLLVPAYFCTDDPVTLIDDARQPILVYPAYFPRPHEKRTLADVLPRLGGILGHTRTRILVALQTAQTTTTLAEQTGVSLATASQQVALLRQARLVRSRRHGQSVVHTLDERGRRLLAPE